MAKGALLQLAAKGVQDTFLTQNPSINHFKSVFKQYTSFASEQIKLELSSSANFGKKVSCIIPRKGDLLGNMYLYVKLPRLVKTSGEFVGWTNSTGNALVEYVELEIGGQVIDKNYGLFMEIWDELTNTKIQNKLIGKYDTNLVLNYNAESETEYYIPLKFWFHDNLSLSLPLLCLTYHEVKLNIKLRDFSEMVHYDGATPPEPVDIIDARVSANYIFLENEQRKEYVKTDQKFFITQLQLSPVLSIKQGTKNLKSNLEFNHPCKELFWVFREIESETNNDWFNFSKRVPNGELVTSLLKSSELLIDGTERFSENEIFFRTVQQDLHHTNVSDKHIYIYSFSKLPEEYQPSGTLNFSKISDSVMNFQMIDSVPDSKVYIFTVNYNWLIMKKGMSGLAFNS